MRRSSSSSEIGQREVLTLAKALIACPSVTPSDAGCQPLIAHRLKCMGFCTETIEAGGVTNLWARHGEDGPLLVFAGHTDVVPPGVAHDWKSPAFEPVERDGFLYGRGAADMKTSLAAMIVACEEYLARPGKRTGSIAFLLTSDEEGPAEHGSRVVCERLAAAGVRADYALVGEPTSQRILGDCLKYGRRGSLGGRLTVHGVQAHIAYPHLGRNPVHLLAPALVELSQIRWDEGTPEHPATSWQVSNLRAGVGALNVTPAQACVDFNFRYSPASSADALRQRFMQVLQNHDLSSDIDWLPAAEPYLTNGDRFAAIVSRAIEAETGNVPERSTSGGISDGRFLAQICDQVIEFGPVGASIHKVDEHVRLADMAPLKNIYLRILQACLPSKDNT